MPYTVYVGDTSSELADLRDYHSRSNQIGRHERCTD